MEMEEEEEEEEEEGMGRGSSNKEVLAGLCKRGCASLLCIR